MDGLKKVNIFLIGSRKSATTSMANFLGGHKEISLSSIKESNYWDDKAIERIETISAYHDLFDWSVTNQLDASTGYTSYPYCDTNLPKKIFQYNKDAKFIYLIRHPIDRIISHYKMSFERGDLSGSLNEALVHHPLLIACGKYYTQLERFLEFFPKEQLLVLSTDEIKNKEFHRKLIQFLNLKIDFETTIAQDNSAIRDFRMPRKAEGILNSKLFSSIKRLFPKSVVRGIKRRMFNSVNVGMDTSLNNSSLALLKKELYSDVEKLNAFIDLDIDNWKNFKEYQ